MNYERDNLDNCYRNQTIFEFFLQKLVAIINDSFTSFIAGTIFKNLHYYFLCFLNNQIQLNRRDVFLINSKVREPFSM